MFQAIEWFGHTLYTFCRPKDSNSGIHLSSLVTAASNASWFAPPSPAPENWLVAARIPPEYAPNFLGKNSGGNGSFKRRNG